MRKFTLKVLMACISRRAWSALRRSRSSRALASRSPAAFDNCADRCIVKPNPAIYTRVEEGTETAADEIAFIDDSALNVSAALRAGWTAHLWSSDADSRAWLTQIGVLPRR